MKYFFNEDGSPIKIIQELDQTSQTHKDLLKTIKLSKNVFKLTLPSAAYGIQDANYQTMPTEKIVKKASQQRKRDMII